MAAPRSTRWRRSRTAWAANSSTTRWPATSDSMETWQGDSARSSLRSCGAFWPSTSAASPKQPRLTASTLSRPFPSSDQGRDDHHPLRHIVGELVGPTRNRHQRLLRRTGHDVPARTFSELKFHAVERLHGDAVLLIDDTWTTGASAQSAAAALKAAGAGPIAAVVIGRHLNREWHQNDRRLRGIAQPFEWADCALCAEPVAPQRPQS